MALTLNNFWGAETGGMEEAYSFSGISALTDFVNNGSYSYGGTGGGADNVSFLPFSPVVDAGGSYIIGFSVYFDGSVPNMSGSQYLFGAQEDLTTSNVTGQLCGLNINSSSQLVVMSANSLSIRTCTTTPLVVDSWNYIELYFEHSASATVEVFINGVSQGSDSSEDLDDGGTFNLLNFEHGANSDIVRIDDIYFLSGATSSADRLGGCEVLSYRSSLNSTTPDTDAGAGSAADLLDAGTWLGVQTIPWTGTTGAEYTASGGGAGSVITNDIGYQPQYAGAFSGLGQSIRFNSDGTKIFYANANNVGERALSTAWDISTAGSETTYDPAEIATGDVRSVFFNGDGTIMYILGCEVTPTHDIYQYTLSTGFLISTATYASKTVNLSSAITNRSDAIYIGSSGTKLFINNGSQSLLRFNISTAWDISTCATTSDQTDTRPEGGFDFSPDGLTIIYEVVPSKAGWGTLSTAWGIGSLGVAPLWKGGTNNPTFGDSGNRVYDSGASSKQFDLASPYVLTSPGGPTGDPRITGDIIAAKGIITMFRSGGGGTDHYLLLGNDTDGTTRSVDLAPTTSPVTYFMVSEAASIVPTSSEFLQIGFESVGNQDFSTHEMLATILHVPAVGGGAGIVYSPYRAFQHLLMR